MKYEAVIFDLFGTLIHKFPLREHRRILSKMASVVSAPPHDFIRLWFDTFDERGLGIFTSIEANVEYICQKIRVKPENAQIELAAHINLEYTARTIKPLPDATEVLSYLKSHGYRIGLISNCSSSIPQMVKNMPFAPLIDVSVYSSLVGIQKPDPRIYQLAVEQLAVEPASCLYVGDGDSQELTGAAEVGMHPLLLCFPDEDSTDVHRVDAERDVWDGPVISSLSEVLPLLESRRI